MKCPACGMETPEEPGYCDFCKEPFRKKAEAAKAAAPAKPAAPAVKITPEVYAKLLDAAKPRPPEEKPFAPIPPEFARLDDGGRIGEAPPLAKTLAWVFLALVIFWTLVGSLYFAHKASTFGGTGAAAGPR